MSILGAAAERLRGSGVTRGTPTCPPGYYYSHATQQCVKLGTSTVEGPPVVEPTYTGGASGLPDDTSPYGGIYGQTPRQHLAVRIPGIQDPNEAVIEVEPEAPTQTQPINCPSGYRYDSRTHSCVRINEGSGDDNFVEPPRLPGYGGTGGSGLHGGDTTGASGYGGDHGAGYSGGVGIAGATGGPAPGQSGATAGGHTGGTASANPADHGVAAPSDIGNTGGHGDGGGGGGSSKSGGGDIVNWNDPMSIGQAFQRLSPNDKMRAMQEVKRFNCGGMVYKNEGADIDKHPGEPVGTDDVPAWLTEGEFVIDKDSTEHFRPVLEMINEWEPSAEDADQLESAIVAELEELINEKAFGDKGMDTSGEPIGPSPEMVEEAIRRYNGGMVNQPQYRFLGGALKSIAGSAIGGILGGGKGGSSGGGQQQVVQAPTLQAPQLARSSAQGLAAGVGGVAGATGVSSGTSDGDVAVRTQDDGGLEVYENGRRLSAEEVKSRLGA